MKQIMLCCLFMAMMLIIISCAAQDEFFGNYYNISSRYNGDPISINIKNKIVQQFGSLDNQKFLLIPSDIKNDKATASSYYIISKYNSEALRWTTTENTEKDPINRLIKLLSANQEDIGVKIESSTFQATPDQRWKLKSLEGDDEGYYAIFSYLLNGQAITVSNQNSLLVLYRWINYDSQKWKIDPVESALLPALAQPEIGRGEINKDLPNLTGLNGDIPYETIPRIVSEKYIPCIYVNDPNQDQDKAKTNPWYRLRFSQFWRKDDKNPPIELDDTRTRRIKVKHVIGSQKTDIEKFEEIVDKKISAEIRASIEVYRGSASGKWETLNGKSQILEDGFYAEDTYEDEVIFHSNKRKIIYFYQMIDQYTILDSDENSVCELDVQTPTTREVPYPNDLE